MFILKAANLFKRLPVPLAVLLLAAAPAVCAAEAEMRKHPSGLYHDIFNRNVYDEFTNYLHLERFGRKVAGLKLPAADVNLYDEVSDSSFFVNRHARNPLSAAELKRGPGNGGPDLSGELLITRGKTEGLHPGFFVRDAKGDEYIFKFDPVDFMELVTSAEVIGSRFYYAIGYHVPETNVVIFDPSKLKIDASATIVDETGFKKKLTDEKLQELLLFLPQDEEGRLRASTSKILPGETLGPFFFHGRRRGDAEDSIPHEERRTIRALRVFASWLNNYDQRESNSMDVIRENGSDSVKHYLIDFNSSMGAAAGGAKPPMFSHEHMADYGEAIKAFVTLGIWEKPWQKRWSEAGEELTQAPAVGYFDNRRFDPGRFKTQLPHYAFKDLTRADAFWAAKIITRFSDEDIEALVSSGEMTNPEDAKALADIFKERRDIIGRYWFSKVSPLDDFELSSGTLSFKDLAVERGYENASGTVYHVDAYSLDGKRRKKIGSTEFEANTVDIREWLDGHGSVELEIRVRRPGSGKRNPWVRVTARGSEVTGVWHQD